MELDTFGLMDVTGGNQVPGPHLSSNSQQKGLSSPPDTSPQENGLGFRGTGSKLPTPNSGLLHTEEDAGSWREGREIVPLKTCLLFQFGKGKDEDDSLSSWLLALSPHPSRPSLGELPRTQSRKSKGACSQRLQGKGTWRQRKTQEPEGKTHTQETLFKSIP